MVIDRNTLIEFGLLHRLNWKTDCWEWIGIKQNALGHGQFPRKVGGTRIAHRVSWLIHCGPIPRGMNVCHKCDVASCVNPNHLFLGTQLDNMRDMIAKGRAPKKPTKTHCVKGHAFTAENTFRKDNGCKGCRRCAADRALAYKARNLEAVRAYQRARARRIREAQKWQ